MFGISKQAYHQRIRAGKQKEQYNEIVLKEVAKIRKKMPQTGTRKLYEKLQPVLQEQDVKIGRDALFELLRYKGLLVRKTKRFHITTNSKHFYYTSPNLIKELEINHSEQVFVSDITYIKTDEGHAYLALVTDAYSKKIMGWSFDDNMKVSMVKEALNMAYNNRKYQHQSIIHHSDRGMQYCCPDYTEFAKEKGFVMSTTQQSDPYENAIAERINGILKYEFGLRKTIASIAIARAMIKEAVDIYNNDRLHWSLDLKTPQMVHSAYNQQKYKSYKRQAA
ncbi:MAG TPA: IS3 family transposase [Flavisolibacter sp.]